MSKRALVSISFLAALVVAGCARPFTPPAVPASVPPAERTITVVAKDPAIGGCRLEAIPPVANARNGQSIRWVLAVQHAHCVPENAEVKIVMKWRDCRGRPNKEEPITFDPPGAGFQRGQVKGMAVSQQQCFQYGIFAGDLFLDPELILDI
jgi:hypothetical protein